MEDRVTNGRRSNGQARLTDSGGIFLAHHHVDFDLRGVFNARHLVIMEIGLLDAPILDSNGVVQGGGETVNRGTFDL